MALERLGLLVVFVAVIVVLGFRGEALAAVLALTEVFIPHVRASDVDLKEKLVTVMVLKLFFSLNFPKTHQ